MCRAHFSFTVGCIRVSVLDWLKCRPTRKYKSQFKISSILEYQPFYMKILVMQLGPRFIIYRSDNSRRNRTTHTNQMEGVELYMCAPRTPGRCGVCAQGQYNYNLKLSFNYQRTFRYQIVLAYFTFRIFGSWTLCTCCLTVKKLKET